MKKFYYLAVGIVTLLVTIMACQTSEIELDEIQTLLKEEVLLSKGAPDLLSKGAPDKVTICHYDADLDEYFPISISTSASDKHMMKHGDKFLFSPEGTYTFKYAGTYSHDYIIDSFDGFNFTGYGGYPAGNATYVYPYNQILSGTVIDGELLGKTTYENGSSWIFKGVVDECGGIISLEGNWELVD